MRALVFASLCLAAVQATGTENRETAEDTVPKNRTRSVNPEVADRAYPTGTDCSGSGNGYCEDLNNHPGCDWDGGDCCNNMFWGWNWYCSHCLCHLNSCLPQLIGDGICNDENNKEDCSWDGGDCCPDLTDCNLNPDWNKYCTHCDCNTDHQCKKDWIGDGICDDKNNFHTCQWDGGDCCDKSSNYWDQDCRICKCHTEVMASCDRNLHHDGYCHDQNNNAVCGWDGGDCCNNPRSDWDSTCTFCQCNTDYNCDNWILSNGYCDDENNNHICHWDGWDCCNNPNEDRNDYCSTCGNCLHLAGK